MTRRLLLTPIVFATILGQAAPAAQPITLHACVGQSIKQRTPTCGPFGVAPVTVLLRIHVPVDPENRVVEIRTSDDSYTSQIWFDEGQQETIFLREWRIQEAGIVEVAAYLVTRRGITGMDRAKLTIC